MPRLIDADALKEKCFGKRGGLIHTSDVDNMPTIEIIRCRDCKYWDPFPSSSSAPEYHQCKRFGGVMMGSRADDYCSYAERREVSE